jgi:dihydroorotate dehydrogenase
MTMNKQHTPNARARNAIFRAIYAHILKPIFFLFDPEIVHDFVSGIGERLGRYALTRGLVRSMLDYEHPSLEQVILDVYFRNPVGLSAGFDKNARLTDIMPAVGFGFMEAGSVTGKPCKGNPKPRLWRLPAAKSLLVYYGLANDGAEAIRARLTGKRFAIPVGMSVAMTNCAETLDMDAAIEDYARAFSLLEPIGSYVTVNISCPNTQGGQPFLNPERLERLLARLDTIPTHKPVFIKLSPDMDREAVDAALSVAAAHRVQGIICTNLTKRGVPKGGLSGKSVVKEADALLAHVYKAFGTRFTVIGVGGIFTAEDAYRKIRLGASLVQLITGMIFEGPQLVSEINIGLAKLLARDGFASVSDAIGVDNPALDPALDPASK